MGGSKLIAGSEQQEVVMTGNRASVRIYSTAIPVAGWGGLALLALAAVIAVMFPEARLILVCGVVGGALLAVSLILRYRAKRRDSVVEN
jgi:hypothetical protein